MRNWARDQHAFLFSDFKDAFKSNWKQALGVSALTSVVPLVAYTAVSYYGEMTKGSAVMFVPLMLVLSATLMLHCHASAALSDDGRLRAELWESDQECVSDGRGASAANAAGAAHHCRFRLLRC